MGQETGPNPFEGEEIPDSEFSVEQQVLYAKPASSMLGLDNEAAQDYRSLIEADPAPLDEESRPSTDRFFGPRGH